VMKEMLIVGRGGGSMEDLWAFNEEAVARAIFRSRIPVISAVGHEVDYTIADFVADLRAPTPTAAAEMVVQTRKECQDQLEFQGARLDQGIRRCIETSRGRLRVFQRSLRDPRRLRGVLEAVRRERGETPVLVLSMAPLADLPVDPADYSWAHIVPAGERFQGALRAEMRLAAAKIQVRRCVPRTSIPIAYAVTGSDAAARIETPPLE